MNSYNEEAINELKVTIVELLKQAFPQLTHDEIIELASILYNNPNEDHNHLIVDYFFDVIRKEGEHHGQ